MPIFRIKKNKSFTIMSNHHLRNPRLSLKAKGLLSQMLSLPEDWDYTLQGLARINQEGIDAIRAAVKELENEGYIIRSRCRNEKGQLTGAEYIIYEQPISAEPESTPPILENPTLEQPTQIQSVQEESVQEKSAQEKPVQVEDTQLNKELLNTELQNIESNQILSRTSCNHHTYERIVKSNICYDALVHDFTLDKNRIDEIVSLIVETLCSRRNIIRIAGDDYPANLVKAKFLNLDFEHIKYVLESLRQTTTQVHNIKKYLLATLFNAPSTISNYYTSRMNHDLYG